MKKICFSQSVRDILQIFLAEQDYFFGAKKFCRRSRQTIEGFHDFIARPSEIKDPQSMVEKQLTKRTCRNKKKKKKGERKKKKNIREVKKNRLCQCYKCIKLDNSCADVSCDVSVVSAIFSLCLSSLLFFFPLSLSLSPFFLFFLFFFFF